MESSRFRMPISEWWGKVIGEEKLHPDSQCRDQNSNELFKRRYSKECKRVNRFIIWLMVAQWFAGIAFAMFYSPLTWIGDTYEIHVHVWAAIVLGGAISGLAIIWLRTFEDAGHSRHVIAICQMLWSALLIHLSGGRIETHFHIFASLAILSIYRDWKILLTATSVAAADHFIRGVFYPLSAFGVVADSPFRWIEHTAWVLFEVSFLAPGCHRLRNEILELCVRQTEIEQAKNTVDFKVEMRTRELTASNHLLEIKTSEAEKLALVARYTDNGVVITDDEGRIEWANEGFELITGFDSNEILGKRTSDFLDGLQTDSEKSSAMAKAIENEEGFDFELLQYCKNGQPFWMSIEGRPIRNQKGDVTRFIAIERDISDRVYAEVERQKLNERLVDASRAAGIAEVAVGVLHNVGNALNSVNISASLIQNNIRKSAFQNLERLTGLIEEHPGDFGEFVANDRRGRKIPEYMLKVTDALRDERSKITTEFQNLISNVDHIKKIVAVQQETARTRKLNQTLSIQEVIQEAIAVNDSPQSNHQITIRPHIQEDLPDIESDRRKILHILANLLDNAMDSLVESANPDPRIDIYVRAAENEVLIEVSDNGVGIPNGLLSTIFQHGFSTQVDNHGFGLHCSANAAAELRGSLIAISEGTGHGATFRLALPIRQSKSATENSSTENSATENSAIENRSTDTSSDQSVSEVLS